MALEYIDPKLFKELYKWALIDQDNPVIKDLEELTKITKNREEIPEQYRKWSDEKIIRWLKSEPDNLYEKKLLKYFYLTRESLDINVSVSDSLSKDELKVFNRIVQSKRGAEYGKLINGLKDNKEIKYTKIIDALIEQFKDNIELLGKIQVVYINYEEYRTEIMDIIKKFRETDITLQRATILGLMYQVDKKGFADVISELEKNGIAPNIIEVITEER